MRAILVQEAGLAPGLVLLADEMPEDPRCLFVRIAADADGAVLFSLWDPVVADEVFLGVASMYPETRLLTLADEPAPPQV